MALYNETHNMPYKYNIMPDVKQEYLGEDLRLVIKNSDDIKDEYDWQGNEIIINSYPRSGTHMTWNIVRYMLQGTTQRLPDAMTESGYPPYFRLEGSPQTGNRRVLYSHSLPCQYANDDILRTGNRKVIYPVRNPNDCAVSTFHIWHDSRCVLPKEFPAYYEEFITGTTKVFPGCSWFNHIKAWEEYVAKNPDVSVLFLIYEDLQRKPRENLKKIADFLDIQLSETFLDELVEASKFERMRKNKIDQTALATLRDGHDSIYRKGVIGDWKNWLTVKNYELFQKVFPEQSADMRCRDRLVFT